MKRNTTLVVAGLAVAAAAVPAWFLFAPGRAERALSALDAAQVAVLVVPHGFDDLTLAGWRLATVQPGPECAVHFRFQAPTADSTASFHLEEFGEAPGWRLRADAAAPGELEAALHELLSRNDAGAFLAEHCLYVAEPGGPKDGGPALWFILALLGAGLVLAGVAGRCRGPVVAASRRAAHTVVTRVRIEPPTQPGRFATGLLYVLALVPRLYTSTVWPLHDYELHVFTRPEDVFSPPLHDWLIRAWSDFGGVFGVGVDLFWLRLPNVLACLWLVRVLLRLGRHLEAAWSGFFAASLFAVLPSMILLSTKQEHYFAEMVCATWFLERVVAYIRHLPEDAAAGPVWRRWLERVGPPGQRTLVLATVAAAVLAIWLGYMSWLVVAPGIVAFAVVAIRRRDTVRVVVVVALVGLAGAPLLGRALHGASGYHTMSNAGDLSESERAAVAEDFHFPVAVESGIGGGSAVRFVPALLSEILWFETTVFLAIYTLLSALALRRGIAWLFFVCVALHVAAATQLYLTVSNTAAIWPLLVFVPLWSLEALRLRVGRIDVAWLVIASGSVAVALVALSAVPDRLTANPIFEHRDPAGVVAAAAGDAPILHADAEGTEYTIIYELCRSAPDREAFTACFCVETGVDSGERVATPDWSVHARVVAGRPMLAFKHYGKRAPEARGGAPLSAFLTKSPWKDEEFFLVIDQGYVLEETAFLGRLRGRCEPISEPGGFRVYRCPPYRAF